ncbi:tetratricopeptide repeat protein 14-like [Hydractinia symbiolongicarpus]|uniref:tetratricopeptide repeat protein 14-like n=1 Tax=Hydractinia symbiolongicarpus TaxID=13093 RepID=UPI002550EA1F|nr:tetratricopeptide repeat protein 14-like [Hydractinia symbiolongicarpus]
MTDEVLEDAHIRFRHLISTFSMVLNNTTANADKHNQKEECIDFISIKNVEPIERYLSISAEKRYAAFFNVICTYIPAFLIHVSTWQMFTWAIFAETISRHDIVVGAVVSLFDNSLSVALLSIAHDKARWIKDLNIVAKVEFPSEYIKRRNIEVGLEIGDKVKGVVITVDRELHQLEICFDEKLLKKDQIHLFPLGKLEDDEEDNTPSKSNISPSHDYHEEQRSLLKKLCRSASFMNPNCVQNFINYLQINDKCNSFLSNGCDQTFVLNESVEVLRERQSYKWSMNMVGVGIKHFRSNQQKQAMKCFDQALTFYPNNVEGYVARGALKANRNELKNAAEDFRQALKLNSNHQNGKKYLIETLSTLAKGFEKQLKWKEALHCYKEIDELQPDHEEALERHQKIKQILTRQIMTASLSQSECTSTLSDISIKKIEKLKKLLRQETELNDKSSSSSPSSSSSESDTDSSNSWVEKKSGLKHAEREKYQSTWKMDRKTTIEGSSKFYKSDLEGKDRGIHQALRKKLQHFSSVELKYVSELLKPCSEDTATKSHSVKSSERRHHGRYSSDDERISKECEDGVLSCHFSGRESYPSERSNKKTKRNDNMSVSRKKRTYRKNYEEPNRRKSSDNDYKREQRQQSKR